MPIHPCSPRVVVPLRHILPALSRAGTAAVFVILVGSGPVFAQEAGRAAVESLVPANLATDDSLRAVVARIAQRSPTFRRQCALLDRTRGLVIRMRDAGPRRDLPYSARTVIRRHQYGALVAVVDLYPPLDPAEIIAHEFEHLIEQIEGVNLRLLSLVAGSGVTQTFDGSYETRRAVVAGRRVSHECSAAGAGGVVGEATY